MEKKNWRTGWNKTHSEWQKKNTVRVNIMFFKTTDADIIEALKANGTPMATEAKRLIRLGIEAMKKQADIHSDIHTDESEQE